MMIELVIELPTWPSSMAAAVEEALRELEPEVIAAAREGWPVRTGTSRDAWVARTTATATGAAMEIRNPADQGSGFYAGYVRASKSAPPSYEVALLQIRAIFAESIPALREAAIAALQQE